MCGGAGEYWLLVAAVTKEMVANEMLWVIALGVPGLLVVTFIGLIKNL